MNPLNILIPDPDTRVDDMPAPPVPVYVPLNDAKGNTKLYVHKTTRIGTVLVPARDPRATSLPTIDVAGLYWRDIPTFPANLMDQIYSFFHEVHETHDAEAIVLLTLDDANQWHAHAPKQTVSAAGLNWTNDLELPDDESIVGSIHSHNDFSAFHSGTDEADAARNDGLHITIGHVDTPTPDFDIMVSFGKIRWLDTIKTDELISTDYVPTITTFPDEWLLAVHKAIYTPTKYSAYPTKYTPTTTTNHQSTWETDEWWIEYQKRKEAERDKDSAKFQTHTNWEYDTTSYAIETILRDLDELTTMASDYGLLIDYNISVE